MVLGLFARTVLQKQQGRLSRANLELAQLKQADESGVSERRNAAPQLQHEFLPTQWPHRAEVDQVVQNASFAAVKQGLTIRSLSVSHQAATPTAWGRVTLDIATNGSYAASKAWQAALQHRHPALAVQKLQLQTGATAMPSSIDGQWTWVLHVRD